MHENCSDESGVCATEKNTGKGTFLGEGRGRNALRRKTTLSGPLGKKEERKPDSWEQRKGRKQTQDVISNDGNTSAGINQFTDRKQRMEKQTDHRTLVGRSVGRSVPRMRRQICPPQRPGWVHPFRLGFSYGAIAPCACRWL